VEFHCHGGRAVTDAVLAALSSCDGLRLAQPGEFTRRAFDNGRIDLTQAEGLADLIEAETESQRKAALAVAHGGLRQQIAEWQDRLLALSAAAERAIDYDEEHAGGEPAAVSECSVLEAELQAWLQRPPAERLKDGLKVVVAGPPNAGKSSLLNMIAGEEKAIVTAVPGTTRDQIEVPLSLGGVPIVLTDTAGLRAAEDEVEAIGVGRARQLVEAADVLLWLGEPGDAPPHAKLILVHTKTDLPERKPVPSGSLGVSVVDHNGLAELMARVRDRAQELLPASDAIALNRRQRSCIEQAAAGLSAAAAEPDAVLFAEHIRVARGAFDRLTGKAGIEDLLDALFSRFCLGK
jgi:tRNA modification GTPase